MSSPYDTWFLVWFVLVIVMAGVGAYFWKPRFERRSKALKAPKTMRELTPAEVKSLYSPRRPPPPPMPPAPIRDRRLLEANIEVLTNGELLDALNREPSHTARYVMLEAERKRRIERENRSVMDRAYPPPPVDNDYPEVSLALVGLLIDAIASPSPVQPDPEPFRSGGGGEYGGGGASASWGDPPTPSPEPSPAPEPSPPADSPPPSSD